MNVRLSAEPFDPGAELASFLERPDALAGAAVTFTGTVRSSPGAPVESLTLEHYPSLARTRLETLRAEAIARFGLLDAAIVHRFGTLVPGEPIVQVMALAPHRRAAFEAASFLMDTLKTDAPFWKKEARPDGAHWVGPRPEDDEAAARWR